MSFDVMLLDPDEAPTAERIYEILESDEAATPLSPRLKAAIDERNSRWPAYDPAGNELDAPWASWPLTPEAGPPVIEMNIKWNHADIMLPDLIELAARHNIVLHDPQKDEVHLPQRLR